MFIATITKITIQCFFTPSNRVLHYSVILACMNLPAYSISKSSSINKHRVVEETHFSTGNHSATKSGRSRTNQTCDLKREGCSSIHCTQPYILQCDVTVVYGFAPQSSKICFKNNLYMCFTIIVAGNKCLLNIISFGSDDYYLFLANNTVIK